MSESSAAAAEAEQLAADVVVDSWEDLDLNAADQDAAQVPRTIEFPVQLTKPVAEDKVAVKLHQLQSTIDRISHLFTTCSEPKGELKVPEEVKAAPEAEKSVE